MQTPGDKTKQFTPMTGVFLLMLMAVFETELTIMQLIAEITFELPLIQKSFLDAFLLVCIIALPLWFFVFSPTLRKKIHIHKSYKKIAVSLYFSSLVGLFLIQFVIMFFLPTIAGNSSFEFTRVLDGILTVIFSAPLFWWLLHRLEIHLSIEPLADLVTAPQTLLVLLLYMIFLADLMQEFLFAHLRLDLSSTQFQLLDAFITIVLIAPLLFILVVRPLRLLALSEKARASLIYDQVIDAIIKLDAQGVIQSYNSATRRIFSLSDEVMYGKSANFLLNVDQIDINAELDKLSLHTNIDALFYNNLKTKRQDGSPLNLDVSISKVERKGPDEYLLIARDTTQHKATEDALSASNAIFRQIFDQTEDAILFFKKGSHEILNVNATSETLYGYKKRELRKLGAHAFCDEKSYPVFMKFLNKVERKGQAQLETLHQHNKEGEQLNVSIRGKILNLPDSENIYMTVRDISERVRLENEAREIESKLIMANKMTSLGLMVSGVAHEINNPNNYILANAQMLDKIWRDAERILQQYYQETGEFMLGGIPFTQLEEQAPKIIDGLSDGSQRITAIVKNLKRFARQDTDLIETDVDINSVVSAAVSLLHQELIKHTDDFNLDLADDLPPVSGSVQQLGQVILNLVMNACQALPDRSGKIEVSTRFDKSDNTVVIRVYDEGGGFPAELNDKIFTPFFSTKLKSGGTGLGLSISRSIIKEHGGSLEFASKENVGTTFCVKLPAI